MLAKKLIRAASTLVFAFPSVSRAGLPGQSFESGLPGYIHATDSKVSVDTTHQLEGTHALRWDFKDGSSFVFNTGSLGNVHVNTGYANYLKSALVLPVYLPEKGPGHLLIEIRAGEQTAATITVPFTFEGWQKLVYHYTYKPNMKWLDTGLQDRLDNIRVSAHGTGEGGTVWFDHVFFNDPRDWRDKRHAVTEDWQPEKHDFSSLPAPSAADLEKVEELARRIVPQPDHATPRANWERSIEGFRKKIREDKLHLGYGIVREPFNQHHYRPFDHYSFLSSIAKQWNRCPHPDLKAQFAECFHIVNDWLQYQGVVVKGACGKQANYIGRAYVDAITIMTEPLKEHGTLESSLNFIKWSYEYDRRVFGETMVMSMDYFHNEAYRTLLIALAHGDPVERWHHVTQFRKKLSDQFLRSIKPDGSLFHHGFHYYAYGSMGMNSISGTLAILSEVGLPVEKEALDIVRKAVDSIMWYSGKTTLWSLSGRSARGTMLVNPSTIANLAKAYAPYCGGTPDPALLADLARYDSEMAARIAAEYELGEITPASPHNGHLSMPFAALGVHRRDSWLAGVKGYSRYAASGESYAKANRYGLFMAMGQLELLTHPQPLPTVHGSGTRPDEGYDWCAIEGATTVHCPIDRIANGNSGRSPRSQEAFVGGLSNGENGLFVLTYNNGFTDYIMRDRTEGAPAPDPLRALKTWFFFDDRIVCLGSDISTKNVTWPIRTNLFQKFLEEGTDEVRLDDETLSFNRQSLERDASGAALVDPYGNAYFTATDTPVHLRVSEQVSRDSADQDETRAPYATAWIEHGVDPQGAGYQYAILVQPTAEQLSAFDPQSAYTVLQRDANAHIVRDHQSLTTGYVVFNEDAPLPEASPLISVDQPCLVMIEEHDDHLKVAITQPDVRPDAETAAPVTITLRGPFVLPDTDAIGAVLSLTVSVRHGESHVVPLKTLPGPAGGSSDADCSEPLHHSPP